ncbi:MAG: MurR/RpiR family transcriptional regulator [Alphaproteobacteria bacterium]|nr:MurR/RpiR family transcriptional regulator [Alphaproteobacteria bacterium]
MFDTNLFRCPHFWEVGLDNRVTINDLIAQNYEQLSPQLRIAADYVVNHFHDVASRSLRAIAAGSNLNPPTYSRLARALGLNSYEEMRELCRHEIMNRNLGYAQKASLLQASNSNERDEDRIPFALRQSTSAIRNIDEFARELDVARLDAVADRLIASKRVFIAGSLASTGFAQYFGYLANLAFTHWQVIDRQGTSMTTTLTGATPDDALLIIMKDPYARRSVDATQMAHEAGAFVVVISDSILCPASRYAAHSFVVPTDSPQFFSSYVTTLVLLESLMGMVIQRSGIESSTRIKQVEVNNHRAGEYWRGLNQHQARSKDDV